MDPTILKIYMQDSCFALKSEADDFIKIKDKNLVKTNLEERVKFWSKIVEFLDGQEVIIRLSRILKVKARNGQITSVTFSYTDFHCIMFLPSLHKVDEEFIKTCYLKFDVGFPLDGKLSSKIDLLKKFNCTIKDERKFIDKTNVGSINLTAYINLNSISEISMLYKDLA